MSRSTSARDYQRNAVAASNKRALAVAKRAFAAALDAIQITEEVQSAIKSGNTSAMRRALRRPQTSAVLPLVRELAKDAWQAGLKEGKAQLAELFAETDARKKALAARAARAEKYRATGPEMKQAREMAKAFLKSFTAHVRDELADRMAEARASGDPEGSLSELSNTLTTLRSDKGTLAKSIAKRGLGKMATPLEDVDWRAARRAETAAWSVADQVTVVEFVATMDDETTPACQFLDGGTLRSDDTRRLQEYTPGLHFRCRSMFIARPGKPTDVTWDKRIAKTVGEPKASGTQRSYTLRPSQIQIPPGAPNVPPCRHLSEWVG